MILKRASFPGLGKDGRSGKVVVVRKLNIGEKSCVGPRHVEGNWDNTVEA
jgi:hypothetical protein